MSALASASRCVSQVLLPSISVQQNVYQRRSFYWLLYAAANKMDDDRIKQVGPDKACAEWLVKCGAGVRFHGQQRVISDYNLLGPSSSKTSKLADVIADEATLMSIGFTHLKDVTSIEKMVFKRCAEFNDDCISYLVEFCSSSLQHLEITTCGNVSDAGLRDVAKLTKLRNLTLFELPAVKHKKDSFDMLVGNLPECNIQYKDHDNFHMSTEK